VVTIRQVISAVVCVGAGALGGCGDPLGPDAPPFDIRGRYDVGWFVAYKWPDDEVWESDPALPFESYCPGILVIATQGRTSFSGTITIPGKLPICHAGSFAIHGTLGRLYYPGEKDFWSLLIVSDIEPLLGCKYAGRSPGNEGNAFRGSGTVDVGGLKLAFSNIYSCTSGRWWIVAGADGRRSGP